MAFTGAGGSAAASAGAAQVIGSDGAPDQPQRVGLSPRQMELDRRWSFYRCEQYRSRVVAWDGSRAVGHVERETIALAGYVPPGFYIANSETLPIQFRKPTTPYHLTKVIVNRFTSLLFGENRHPKVQIKGDQKSSDFVNAVIEVGRLWPQMMQARDFGGGTGTAVVGFKLMNGRPQFEVFDPRWCTPTFVDRANFVMSELEYKYTFKQDIRDPETGEWVQVDFWYRRVINGQQDVVFEPVMVDPEQEPDWQPASKVDHGLGFCPVAWIQNEANLTDIDGDPDCLGVYELQEAIDRLNAQGEKGILANCDPTTVVSTDATMGEVRKGSENALKIPSNSSAQYMEMTGSGVQQAREQAQLYKDAALEVAQCVLENPDKANMTATEIERNYSAMLARAGKFREQYGEFGIKRLVNMVLVAAASLTAPRRQGDKIVRYAITLPTKEDGSQHQLGDGPYTATLTWPPYFEPSIDDANKAVISAGLAKQSGLVDQAHATKFVAPYFQVEDPIKLASELAHNEAQQQGALDDMSLSGAEPDDDTPEVEAPTKEQDTAFNGAQVTSMVTLVQAVAANQLPVGAAREILLVAFPITDVQADKMLAGLKGATPKDAAVAKPTTPKPAAPPAAPQGRGPDPRSSVLLQLMDDFPPDTLAWVKEAEWEGPVQVAVDDVDYSNSSTWSAAHEPDKVDRFAARIKGGWSKPIVLVKRPNVDKLMVVDGHHRALAYKKLNYPVTAYIAFVNEDEGPWDEFHSQQYTNDTIAKNRGLS